MASGINGPRRATKKGVGRREETELGGSRQLRRVKSERRRVNKWGTGWEGRRCGGTEDRQKQGYSGG